MPETIGTKEWRPNNRNVCSGCCHGCLYCYAMLKEVRYKRRTKEDWRKMRLLKVRQSTKKVEGGIMFPTTHDLPYEHIDWWWPFLREMLANGNEVLIVSKPNLKSIMLICDRLIEYRDQIEFRFTIGTDNEETRKAWEPGAPAISERITALKYAYEAGFKTSVSMEPLLTDDPLPLIAKVDPFVTGEIWIGTMNHMRLSDFAPEQMMMWADMVHINSKETMGRLYQKFSGVPKIRFKDSVRNLLGVA